MKCFKYIKLDNTASWMNRQYATEMMHRQHLCNYIVAWNQGLTDFCGCRNSKIGNLYPFLGMIIVKDWNIFSFWDVTKMYGRGSIHTWGVIIFANYARNSLICMHFINLCQTETQEGWSTELTIERRSKQTSQNFQPVNFLSPRWKLKFYKNRVFWVHVFGLHD